MESFKEWLEIEEGIGDWISSGLDITQLAADAVGFFDPTGVVDFMNAIGYMLRGRFSDALMSLISIIPFADVVKFLKAPRIIKMISKYGKVSEKTAETLARRTAREAIKGGRAAKIMKEKDRMGRLTGEWINEAGIFDPLRRGATSIQQAASPYAQAAQQRIQQGLQAASPYAQATQQGLQQALNPVVQPALQKVAPYAQKAQEYMTIDNVQNALTVVGLMPVVGAPADVANAVLSAAQGDYKDAALNLVSAIPGTEAVKLAQATKLAQSKKLYKVFQQIGMNPQKSIETAAQFAQAVDKAKDVYFKGTGVHSLATA